MILFGPAGNSKSFYDDGHTASFEAMEWLKIKELDGYEYQANRGVNISEKKALELGQEAVKQNIKISIHSSYFISLSSIEQTKRINSVKYILDTLKLAKTINANRIVVHPGGIMGQTRQLAFFKACDTLKYTVFEAKQAGLNDIKICMETMGKVNQLGTIDEIIEMCNLDDSVYPTIDFGHINAREMGILKKQEDFEFILKKFINSIGIEKMKNFHCHFSKIEYTSGGEKKHLTFEDHKFGPDFELLAKALIKLKLEPMIICESDGTQAEDAIAMKNIYYNLI